MKLRDESELVFDEPHNFFRQPQRIALLSAVPSEAREVFERREPRGTQLFGIFVAKFIQGKRTAIGDLNGSLDCPWRQGEHLAEFGDRLEMALAVRKAAPAKFSDSAAMANRREHILQPAAFGDVIVN